MLASFDPDPTKSVAGVAETAMYSIVKDSVFGALLLVAVFGIIWLIRRLLSVQDMRVADQVRANEKMEAIRDKTAKLLEQLTKTSSESSVALERMIDAQSDNVRSLGEMRTTVERQQLTIDSVIRDAVRGRVSRSDAPARNDPQKRVDTPAPVTTSSSSKLEAQRPGSYALKNERGDRGR